MTVGTPHPRLYPCLDTTSILVFFNGKKDQCRHTYETKDQEKSGFGGRVHYFSEGSNLRFSTFGSQLRSDFRHYPIGVIPRVYKASCFQSPSKLTLDMTSIVPVTPIRLERLPPYALHALYTMVLDNPVAMVNIEVDPEFQTAPLVCHYVRLFHHYARSRIDLSVAVALSPMSVQRQMDRLTVKQFETLQLLISVNFGKFLPGNVPSDLLESLLRTTLSLLQPSELDQYLAPDGLPSSESSTCEEAPRLSSIPQSSPSSSPSRNLAGFGQRLSDFVSSLSLPSRDYRYTFTEISSDITTLRRRFPPGRMLRCSRCGSAVHFGIDCPSYACPRCMVSAPGHAQHNCPMSCGGLGSSSISDNSSEDDDFQDSGI